MAIEVGLGVGLGFGVGGSAPETFFPVASRLFFPNESGGAGNTDILSLTHHALFDDVVGRIRIKWPNVRATSGVGSVIGGGAEVGSGAVATATANLTYIDKTTKALVTVNLLDWLTGSTSLTAPDGGVFDAYAVINASAGDWIFPKFAGHFGAGMVYGKQQADIAGGDLFQFGSSPIPLSNVPTNSFPSGLAYYGPCSIRSETQISSWGVCGDSRNALTNVGVSPAPDSADNIWGVAGQIGRLAGKRVPLVNVSIPGETAADFSVPSQSPVRRQLLKEAKSGLFIVLGTNDIIFQGQSAANTKAKNDQIAADLGFASSAIYETIDPATSGNISTPARPATETARNAYNTTIRGLTRKYDPAAVLEVGSSGAWKSTAVVSGDFTHETGVGNQDAADNGGFDFSLIGSPTVLNVGFGYAAGAVYQSLDFSDSWSVFDASMTAALYGPAHRNTAITVKESNTTASHQLSKQITAALAAGSRKFTVFAKRVVGSRNVEFQVQNSAFSSYARVFVNLGSGANSFSEASGAVFGAPTVVITAVDGWWKIEMTSVLATGGTTNPYVIFKTTDASNNDSYAGDNTSSIGLWGLDAR